MMDNVLFNYVVDGIVVEGPMSYAEALQRSGLKDTVGLADLGYIEHMPTLEDPAFAKEQIDMGMRNLRNYLLQQSDWTQVADAPLTEEKKTAWAAYRQELRNVPAVNADVNHPASIVWPNNPDYVAPTE